MTELDDERLLHEFAGADEGRAALAFTGLCRRARPFLAAWSWRAGVGRDQIDDHVQETLLAVWKYRDRFRPYGKAAWYSFLKRVASQRTVDSQRRNDPFLPLSEDYDVPDSEANTEVDYMERQSIAELKEAADCVLLGLDGEEPATVRAARQLALQFFYLDGLTWQEVLEFVSPAFPNGQAPARMTLEGWLTDPAHIRLLAFHHLYSPGDRLVESLIPSSRGSVGPDDAHKLVMHWRFRNGLSWEQIASRKDCPLGEAELDALRVRLPALLPFECEMRALLKSLGRVAAASEPLKNIGLWQRLAFEYWYVQGLARTDVMERLAPAAAVLDVRLSAEAMNMWLSGGRLARRIAEHLRKRDAQGMQSRKDFE